METETITTGIHLISLGYVNAVLLDDPNGPVIVDTGAPGSEEKILEGLKEQGFAPGDVQKIILTHKHIDHAGSLAALKKATGAPVMMHPVDAEMVRKGESLLPVKAAPGLVSRLMYMMAMRTPSDLDPVEIEEEVQDGDRLPLAGGIEVIHTPGHSAGQISLYLSRDGGILIVGDAAIHMMGLRQPPFHEDMAAVLASLRRLSGLSFDTAIFMHGKALKGSASQRFKARWGK